MMIPIKILLRKKSPLKRRKYNLLMILIQHLRTILIRINLMKSLSEGKRQVQMRWRSSRSGEEEDTILTA
jgi:hypothetical protein